MKGKNEEKMFLAMQNRERRQRQGLRLPLDKS